MKQRFSSANSALSDGARLGPDQLLPGCHRGLPFGPRWRPSQGQRHGQDSIIAGVKRRSILILTAFLASVLIRLTQTPTTYGRKRGTTSRLPDQPLSTLSVPSLLVLMNRRSAPRCGRWRNATVMPRSTNLAGGK